MILAGRLERIGSNASSPDTGQGLSAMSWCSDFSDARLREKAALWQAAVIDALASRVGTGEKAADTAELFFATWPDALL